ncbi:hypothetical protein BDD43_2318 [Mucilaginibacter gracilis]|uniref:Uncharacterized protein n=1 Tax=Mucilaginibacter gracilis TaxID=423350 RepID=A0A495J2B3_9SPHI|nr:hypothetical protein [Mucilaginibacter gracilis]RKR82149.1 hypothetical protein BDD43_2318 [Mucilaginibacter gracilis]
MATNSVLGTVFETLLCSPGMSEAVKIDLKVSRKTILLLNSLIENGIGTEANASGLAGLIPGEDREELKNFGEECLKKAGLKELSEKIKTLKS